MMLRCSATVLVLVGGCFDVPGNDPNVPDDASIVDARSESISCARALPTSCASAPTYTTEVAPIVARACLPSCHEPNGTASDRDLTTYANIEKIESTVLSQVYACSMPPPDAGPDVALTSQDRDMLLQWLVCGSPD
jgi:hypothetical protein